MLVKGATGDAKGHVSAAMFLIQFFPEYSGFSSRKVNYYAQ